MRSIPLAGARVAVEHVSRSYGRAEVLRDVSFVIEPGEVVALTGPSGSGKTTLLQLLGSLDRPTSGRILVDDVDVGALKHPAPFRRSTVGFVFQLHYLLPTLTALQNVELPMAAARVPHRERGERARILLEEVGLGAHADRLPSDLSGGERQRVAIARALANNPRLVLADEPTGSLDTAASRRIGELLSTVRDNRGATILIASHDVTMSELADRSLSLVDGRLQEPDLEAEGALGVTALRQTIATLSHRPARAILTALGTAIGVATIVALLAVSDGAKRTAGQLVHLGRADLGLFQSDAADPTTSVLPTSLVRPLRQAPGVADAAPLTLLVEDVPKVPSAIVFGAVPGSFLTRQMVFSAGHGIDSDHQVVVGSTLASQLHVHPGATLAIAKHPFTVAGIYHLGVAYQDGGAFVSLAAAQRLNGHFGESTAIVVRLSSSTHVAEAKRAINKHFPGIIAISNADEATRAGANSQLITKATLVIAVLALVIGGIGVMNTMLMSVLERRTEFALLSAVGFSGPQVAGLVLTEGVVLSVLGAMAGLVIGAAGSGLLVKVLGASAFVSPDLTAWGFGRALLVGILIGVLGGVYPAWRAARVSPAHVLAQR